MSGQGRTATSSRITSESTLHHPEWLREATGWRRHTGAWQPSKGSLQGEINQGDGFQPFRWRTTDGSRRCGPLIQCPATQSRSSSFVRSVKEGVLGPSDWILVDRAGLARLLVGREVTQGAADPVNVVGESQ